MKESFVEFKKGSCIYVAGHFLLNFKMCKFVKQNQNGLLGLFSYIIPIYSRPSVARTLMASLPRFFSNSFLSPLKKMP